MHPAEFFTKEYIRKFADYNNAQVHFKSKDHAGARLREQHNTLLKGSRLLQEIRTKYSDQLFRERHINWRIFRNISSSNDIGGPNIYVHSSYWVG